MHTQEHALYTPVEHSTWNTLYTRQMKAVQQHASVVFLNGIHSLELGEKQIPDFAHINTLLYPISGWTLYAVPGLIDNRFFFEQLHGKQFGATTWIRTPEQLDYLEEPDMFHDVFGHVPLLADPDICSYLHGLSIIANRYIDNETIIEAIARLYWYTIEFGLIRENGQLKIYGAGILSSIGETTYALSDIPRHVSFDIRAILDTPYIKDNYQQQYFVLENISQLKEALPVLENIFATEYSPVE
jgi:phenylalanine-4-hydroxylase